MNSRNPITTEELDAALAAPRRRSHEDWLDEQRELAEREVARTTSLSNRELAAELEPRDDLTTLEFILLDRLIQSIDTLDDLERHPPRAA